MASGNGRRGGASYTRVAIALHWLIALALIAMIPMGLWMADAIGDPARQALAYRLFQLHKSIGFTILALTLLRIVWRLAHPAPPLPSAMAGWERFAARATQACFYLLTLAIPLTGWIYVSAGWAVGGDRPLVVATSWFGLFTIPHLPFVPEAAETMRRAIAFGAIGTHEWLSWATVALILLHAGAALKHHFIERDAVLAQMLPLLGRGHPAIRLEDGAVSAGHGSTALVWSVAAACIAVVGVAGWIAATPAPKSLSSSAAGSGIPAGAAPAALDALASEPITPGTARAWAVDPATSEIDFSGTHAGKDFRGRFTRWTAHIWFDPADLPGSKAIILIETGSAKTGDSTQQETLAEAEWFDVAAHPVARFDSETMKPAGAGRFIMTGTLRVKGKAVPVTLPFTFEKDGARAVATGSLTLSRAALDLGMVSDPDAAWVSADIPVTIRVQASPAP